MIKFMYHIALTILLFCINLCYGQTATIAVQPFDKVIISPHIQATFIQGDKESVSIKNARLSHDKIHIEVIGRTLQVYLDGAKMITKNVETTEKGWKSKKPIYKETMATAIVTYKEVKELSIGGEEVIICESPIEVDEFKLKIYGESKVTINSLKVNSLQVAIYGENYLEIKEGIANNQKYTMYGESTVNSLRMSTKKTKITAYGEGNFRINVSDQLKITAYGEATVAYDGNPIVKKGIVIGKATIQQIN
ncbi:head GIN domain-containing protein [Aquimarina longa]|uniref:head GIN domain-containing protein n=1 Tax=Aquimarina longa TaxID=1080221 RepID=UPI000ACE6C59|nr:head GIN domain-containing protein [Aquimarina longa]